MKFKPDHGEIMSNPADPDRRDWWNVRNKVSDKRRTKVKESKSHCSYWMDDDSYDYFYDKSSSSTKIKIDGRGHGNAAKVDLAKAARYAAVRRAVSNFVHILTNDDDVKVIFNGGQDSYTDGKVVVISAEHDPKKFDVLVGTALHEAGHCVFSQPILLALQDRSFEDRVNREFPPDRYRPAEDATGLNHVQNVQLIVNFLDDRRIDSEVYRRAPGYRPYYQSMYDNCWNTKEIAKSLIRDEQLNVPTVDAYKFRLINLTNPATKYTLDRLPGFDEIYKLVNLNDILRLSRPDGVVITHRLFDCACAIYKIIIDNYVDPPIEDDVSDDPANQAAPAENTPDTLDNHDIGGSSTQPQMSQEDIEAEVGKEIGTKLGKGALKTDKMKSQVEAQLNGDSKKKKVSKKMDKVVKTMEESDITVSNVMIEDESYPYIRIPRLTHTSENIIPNGILRDAPGDDFCPSHSRKGSMSEAMSCVKRGKRLGQIIVDRIKIRHDNNETKFSRRPAGRIDHRLLHSLGTDNENVFFNKIIQDYKNSVIYLTIDCSSSMWGEKWSQSVMLATGLAYAAKKINNFDIVVNLRFGLDSIWSINMFDSRKEPFSHFERWMPRFMPSSTTPESIVYEIEEKFIEQLKTNTNNVYFITMTDGCANYSTSARAFSYSSGFSGGSAEKHCRHMIKRFKEIGIEILSYYIGVNNSYYRKFELEGFKKSYGKDGVIVPVNNFSVVSKSLNDLLTKATVR